MKISLLLFLFFIFEGNIVFAQNNIYKVEKTTISGGAEYNLLMQKAIKNGTVDNYMYKGQSSPTPPPYAPNAITTVEGINFDEDANNSGFFHIPPDPHGAAGPNNLVSVVNTSIEWFTKAGGQQHSESLASFFSSLSPLTGTFDPKVIYDQYNGRFLVVALEQTNTANGDPANTSRILLAVSNTSDPSGGWLFHEINSKIGNSWADYPGFAVNSDGIFVTCNLFDFTTGNNTGSRLWIIEKGAGSGGFYDGGSASDYRYDPATSIGVSSTTMQPAHMFSTAPSGVLTYLVRYSGFSDGTNEYLSIITVGGTLNSATFSHTWVSLGDIDNTSLGMPNAPQKSTATQIETNDRRDLNAVWRNNYLWTTATVVPPSGTDAGQATAHWFKVLANGSSLSLSDQGDIGGESIATGCYTFFPAIAVNSSGDIVIGFSASALSIYPGCYYTGRLSTDPIGTTITPAVVKAGVDYYVRKFGGSSNRWGDYSGASVDPSDDQTFYVFNEYALTRGTILPSYPTEDGRWGTVFGQIGVSALPVELSSFTYKVISDGIKLNWITQTEVNNYGFEIEKAPLNPPKGEKQKEWEKIGFVNGHGNSNSPKYYSYVDEGTTYGKFAYRLKQIDNDGTFEYSNVIEVDAGDIPNGFVLEQNYPNPFNPETKIKFALKNNTTATLKIYNELGEEITTLFNGETEAGKIYDLDFNAANLPSGVYYYRLTTPSNSTVKKMLLLK